MPESLTFEDAEIGNPHDCQCCSDNCDEVCTDDPTIQNVIVENPMQVRKPLPRGCCHTRSLSKEKTIRT